MKAIVSGMIATYPLGGVAWDYGQYLLGLERLGFDVLYLEDTAMWAYDPRTQTYEEDCAYAREYLPRTLRELSPTLSRWCYRDPKGEHFGMTAQALRDAFAEADIFINVSAATMLRDEYMSCRRKCLIDTDPGANHFSIFPRMESLDSLPGLNSYRAHDYFFTYAERIGKPDCRLPLLDLPWKRTRAPVLTDRWHMEPGGKAWTTVMSWGNFRTPLIHDGITYGAKESEFSRIETLPRHVDATLEVAVSGVNPPREHWVDLGWRVIDAETISRTPHDYQDYVQRSRGEFSVAKNVYVATRSGWFSCRTVCYLACGLPAVVQDTGFTEHIPEGSGLLAFSTLDEAIDRIRAVEREYDAHCAAARDVVAKHFAAERVLADLLTDVGL